MPTSLTASKYIKDALSVLDIEVSTIQELISDIEKNQSKAFDEAIECLLNCTGRIVITGIGKSGHIGSKIAATLASTGSPAFFVHPAELIHGDFGMLKPKDTMLALSFSGETEELKKILIPIKRLGIKLLSITGNEKSTLAQNSNFALFVKVAKEACPLNLAPTASTTATLALGDAISIALMQAKGFTAEDFAKSHPGGSLGKRLITVKDVMRKDNNIPQISETASYYQILEEIDTKKLGFTAVVAKDGNLLGTITDGDIRRTQIKHKKDASSKTASEIMSKTPKTINEDEMAVSALKTMEEYRISDIAVTNRQNKLVGIIDLKDLLKAGII